MYRNKIFVHGKPFKTSTKVSPHSGISFTKIVEIKPLEGVDKRTFLRIKRDYEKQYPDLQIPENPYEIMMIFLREISIQNCYPMPTSVDPCSGSSAREERNLLWNA